ncbi:MAG: AAA family ATPase, partial [Catalinimonas sp.]
LKDRRELFADDVLRLGEHRFSVSQQPLELVMVPRDGAMFFHLTGTAFFEPVKDATFPATRDVWEQALVSENADVYRAEFLAWRFFREHGGTDLNGELRAAVTRFAADRYEEGYVKGVHDQDAARILEVLLELDGSLGLLRHAPTARAAAQLYWRTFCEADRRELWHHRLRGVGHLLRVFPDTREFEGIVQELQGEIRAFLERTGLFDAALAEEAGTYLFREIAHDDGFVADRAAVDLAEAFDAHLRRTKHQETYDRSVAVLEGSPAARFRLVRKWVRAFCEATGGEGRYVHEAAVRKALGAPDNEVRDVSMRREIVGMQGDHAVIANGTYAFDYLMFTAKLRAYDHAVVPRYRTFQAEKRRLLDARRAELRLETFEPRPLASFVRNRLIDEVYLPLIGTNFAKQLGTAGEGQRTDRQGMLLLISPPGYGKTTLMEYLASRLGVTFVKVNGPALGRAVTALDPAEAPNAAAREELEKLNLALEMGDNLMLYLDDIQHLHPEFLQKFISLCDAQRKIEGVFRGRPRTYDLRGRRVAVVMAGNPYTEGGEKFQIPDMLTNRADVYNLGDILGNTRAAFELSYLENSLAVNPALRPLTAHPADLFPLLRLVEGGDRAGLEFEADHAPQALDGYARVLRKLLTVRDVLLTVNQAYIHSAGQADAYRTEPPFKLQGSYRDMNKLAERIRPVMNDEEVRTLLLTHYEQESQTLTADAEANLLKLKELLGRQTDAERARWEEIKTRFAENRRADTNGVAQVVAQMEALTAGIQQIGEALRGSVPAEGDRPPT